MTEAFISTRPANRKRKGLSPKTRFRILNRDGFRCRYCGAGADTDRLHVDHITAVANGGTNEDENLATACATCNMGKSAEDVECLEGRFRCELWRALRPVGGRADKSRLDLLDAFLSGESLDDIGEISLVSENDDDVDFLLRWLSKQGLEE